MHPVKHLAGREPFRLALGPGKKRPPPKRGSEACSQQGRLYSALPPNLCVYCRLMVRPTLSNQDTS